MRTIERTTAFRRDFKREAKGPRRNVLDTDLRRIIEALATDAPLEARHRDHALTGNWKDYRDCHVKPDLVLIYRLIDDARLLYRLSCKGEPALALPRRDETEWLTAHIAGGYTTPAEILDIS